MTIDRAPMGTTAGDLTAVLEVLPPEDGWIVEEVAEEGGDAPWIAAIGPDGVSWAIGRQDGAYFAAADNGWGASWDGLANAWDAARHAAGAEVRRLH